MTPAINSLLNGHLSCTVQGAPDQEADPDDDPLLKAAKKLGGKIREE